MTTVIESIDQLSVLGGGNKVVGSPAMKNSRIIFKGENNLLYCEPGVVLRRCNIEFAGSNGLLVVGSSRNACMLDTMINNNCSLVVGRDVYFNGPCAIIISEECTVSIGDGCLVSSGVRMRTADPHLIYDMESERRINPSKHIIIGDHVWIGQGAYLLKGSFVGSGSIVGAMGVVAGKRIASNTVWGGNPAKFIRKGIFWEGSSVHSWTEEDTKAHEYLSRDDFSFEPDVHTLEAKQFVVSKDLPADERLDHYLSIGYGNGAHNRLAVAVTNAPSKKKTLLQRLRLWA